MTKAAKIPKDCTSTKVDVPEATKAAMVVRDVTNMAPAERRYTQVMRVWKLAHTDSLCRLCWYASIITKLSKRNER